MTLDIILKDVSKYLGYKNAKVDPETMKTIEEVKSILQKTDSYKTHYKIFDINRENNQIKLENTNLILMGDDIKKLLKDCDKCILMAVTLGSQVDSLIRHTQVRNMEKALVMDACASTMAEDLCNKQEEELKKILVDENIFFTDRFSPGYGDLPIESQVAFCDVLNTRKTLGLNLTSSGIMIPSKSITAIIGIADKPQKMKIKGCKYCSFFGNCQFAKKGETCD